MTLTVIQYELIRQLARDGYGYENIAVKLKLDWRDVRPVVIGGRNDSMSSLREQGPTSERKAPEL